MAEETVYTEKDCDDAYDAGANDMLMVIKFILANLSADEVFTLSDIVRAAKKVDW